MTRAAQRFDLGPKLDSPTALIVSSEAAASHTRRGPGVYVCPGAVTAQVVEDCEDAWNELVDGDVTSEVDASDKKVGTNSVKLTVAAAVSAGDILATEAITSVDLSGYTYIKLWIKSDVATAKGDLQLLLDNTASCASPLETLDIPVLRANVWYRVVLALATPSALTAVISVGLKFTVDIGACIIHIDDVRCEKADEVQIQAAINALPTITGGNNRPGGSIQLTEGTFLFANPVMLSNSSSIKDIALHGAGIDATYLKPADSVIIFTTSRTDMEIGSGGISDLTADGQWASYSDTGFFKGCPFDFHFERLELQNFNGNGTDSGRCLWLVRGTGGGGADRAVSIMYCLIQDNVNSIVIDGTAADGGLNGTTIAFCGINGQTGLLIDNCLLTHVTNCGFGTPVTHYAANMTEITTNRNSQGTRIENNHFDIWWSDTSPASFYHAIGLDSSIASTAISETLIQNNSFWGNVAGKTGALIIRVQKGSGNAVQDTRIRNNQVETAGAAGNFIDYSNVTNLSIYGNDMGAVPPTTPITYSGVNTGVVIRDNPGAISPGDIVTAEVVVSYSGTLFDAVGLTDSANVWQQPANTLLLSVVIELDVAFVAASMTDLDVIVGDAGDNDGILVQAMNLTSDALKTRYKTKGAYFDATAGTLLKEAATQWVAYSTAVGANLSTLSAGKVTFTFRYLQL